MTVAITCAGCQRSLRVDENLIGRPIRCPLCVESFVAVADAVCYIFGYAGVITFCTVVVPALLKIDLKTESLKLEQALGITRAKPGLASAWRKFELRAYRLDADSAIVGSTVAAAEARFSEQRVFIHRIRRGDRILEAEPATILAAGDIVALSAPRETIVGLVGARGEEVEDRELLDIALISAEVFLINPKLAGMTLQQASEEQWARGLYLRSLSRGGQALPIGPGLVLERGDLGLTGGHDGQVGVGPDAGLGRAHLGDGVHDGQPGDDHAE